MKNPILFLILILAGFLTGTLPQEQLAAQSVYQSVPYSPAQSLTQAPVQSLTQAPIQSQPQLPDQSLTRSPAQSPPQETDDSIMEEITSGKPDLSAINVLLIDGQGTHNWRETTPVLKRTLEETGLFDVVVATVPPEWEDINTFQPDFSKFDVVLLNYCGELWNQQTRSAFLQFIANGGGLVIYHGANAAFADWPEFQRLLGVTAWNGRSEAFGQYRYWNPERGAVQAIANGPTGTVLRQHEYLLQVCEPNHPIMKDMPAKMLHASDELYSHLRGDSANAGYVHFLAAAYSDPQLGGSGRFEPQLVTVSYGKGRVFQILYGHAGKHLRSVAFLQPFIRGTQWAATGTVTIPIPEDIPTEEKNYVRP